MLWAVKHRYIFTLEIVSLQVGEVYETLPPHLTLMSRFWSDLSPVELSDMVRPLLSNAPALELIFGPVVELGPKKVLAHMIEQPKERELHKKLHTLLGTGLAVFEYPEFVGDNHKAHVTKRENVDFPSGSRIVSTAVYLIEIVEQGRVVRNRIALAEPDKRKNT